MQTLYTWIAWTMSARGHVAAAWGLWAVMMALQYSSWVTARILTTDGRKRLAHVVVGALPAIIALTRANGDYAQIGETFFVAVSSGLGLTTVSNMFLAMRGKGPVVTTENAA